MNLEGVDLRIRFIPSGIPSASTLRASRYRLLITPTPPDDPDLVKERLVTSKMAVFFDPSVRTPPETWEQYLASEHDDPAHQWFRQRIIETADFIFAD